ncbi:MAG: hypothetical protein V5B38_16270 [Candidatus Accumulibacter propinquus]
MRTSENWQALAECQVSEHQISFPERTVVLMYGSEQQFSTSVMTLNCVAELRRAKETAHFFDGMTPVEQQEWVDETLGAFDGAVRMTTQRPGLPAGLGRESSPPAGSPVRKPVRICTR